MTDTSYYGNSSAPPQAMEQGKIFVGELLPAVTPRRRMTPMPLILPLYSLSLCPKAVSRGRLQRSPYDGTSNSTVGLYLWKVRESIAAFKVASSSIIPLPHIFSQTHAVMKDRQTGQPRGFAFVVFADGSTVDLVMDEENHEINHKIVDVKRAQARGVAPPSIHQGQQQNHQQQQQQHTAGPRRDEPTPEQLQNKVFVGGIPPSVDRDELRTIFMEFGPVVDAIVMLDQMTNRSRGFGFVTFENGSDGAKKSVEAQPLMIHGKRVEVKLATPRAEQKRVLPAGPKHVGLRAGQSSSSSGEFAGLAVAYGRSGWKAGYGSKAFGKAGWAIKGWEDGAAPDRAGFSFDMLQRRDSYSGQGVSPKRARLH